MAIVAIVVVAGAGLWWWASRPNVADPRVAAEGFADQWSAGGLDDLTFSPFGNQPGDGEVVRITDGLAATDVGVTVASFSPPTSQEPLRANADLDVTWELPGDRQWSYTTTIDLRREPDQLEWEVAWDPSVVHPDLEPDQVLELVRTPPTRGEVLATDGSLLMGERRVTVIGLHPAKVEDLDHVVATIVAELDRELDVQLDPQEILDDVAAADPDHFVPVVTLRNEDYRLVEDVIFPVTGTRFRDDVMVLGPDPGFARYTLGSAGEVTAEQLEEFPGRWQPGDIVGRSGLQAELDDVLFGSAGWSVVAIDAAEDVQDTVLHEVPPTPGSDVTITLDPSMQALADDVVEGTGHPTSMAVVRISDGHVLALANSSEATFDIARLGQLPPGSVFKIVTATALLQDGVTPQTPVECPNSIQVGDRTITNAGQLALGATTFDQGFAHSCNTVFVALADRLSATAMHDAGLQLGIGTDWSLGIDSFSGDIPVATDADDKALASFGQGRTLVNPLALATAMASLASGQRVSPVLVTDPATVTASATADAAATADSAASQVAPLPADVANVMAHLTRLVVTEGSGQALADLPGAPVHGKTGTAEYRDEDGNIGQHAWFAGWQGDLAFAVVVTETDGGSGGSNAAPIARAFLEQVG